MNQSNPNDSDIIKSLKGQIEKLSKQQDKLVEQYKCVRKYLSLQQEIGLISMKIEQIKQEEFLE